MLTDSMQDVEQFIRQQREKLNREPGPGYNQATINPQTMEYHRQLDNYLASLARSDPYQPSQQLAYPPPAGPPMPAYYQQQQPMFESPQPPPLPQPLRQQRPPNGEQDGDFFNKFGSKYDAQKNKLKNDLRQDYLKHQQQKNASEGRRRNGRGQGDNEYYATLPLKGMESAQEKNRIIRNLEYQILQQKLQSSEKQHLIEWWKDHGEPDVKPYSKHASQENLSSMKSSPFSMETKTQARSQYDVISDRRLHVQNSPRGSNPSLNDMMMMQQPYRNNSAEAVLRQQQQAAVMDTWRPSVPQPISNPALFDSSGLSDILMRPPVGSNKNMSSMMTNRNMPQMYNDQSAAANMMMMNMMSRPQMPVNDMTRMQPLSNSNPNMFNSGSGSLIQQMNKPVTSGVEGGFMFTEEQNKDLKNISKKEYVDELQRQIREKQLAKQREKEEDERLEKKMLIEANVNNPFGRSGGGAPIKDKEGNIVADLSQVRADPEQYSPRSLVPPSFAQQMSMNQPPPSTLQTSNQSRSSEMLAFMMANQPAPFGSNTNRAGNKAPQVTNGAGEPSYVRGGNGIFGEGKSEEQLKREEKYKEELKQQMAEKERQKKLEKEKLRLEEEKEMRRIEEHNKKMQQELEEEEKKKRAKEEAVKQVSEEARQRHEEEKKNKNKPRKFQPRNTASDDSKMSNERSASNLNELPTNNNNTNHTDFRSNSPPIPTIAKSKKTQVAASRTSIKPPMSNAMRQSQANFNAPADYYNTESRLNLASPRTVSEYLNNNAKLKRASSGRDVKYVDFNHNLSMAPKLNSSHDDSHVDYSSHDRNWNYVNGREDTAPVATDPNNTNPEDGTKSRNWNLSNSVEDNNVAGLPPSSSNNKVVKSKPPLAINFVEPEPFDSDNSEHIQVAHNKNRSMRNDDNVIPHKPVLRKVSARPDSNTSNDNTEVLSRLQNLKKHLHKEQQEVENQLHNNNNHTTVGQLTDLNQDLILNVRTPPGDRYGQKTYRKDLTTPPLGMENGHPKSYYRDDTVYLGANGNRNRDPFDSDLQAQARERNSNRANNFHFDKDPFNAPSDADNLAINNQIRLKKLRDSEADSYSMNDPNEVLDKFMSRHNNRQPSARTIHDDTWLRQPN